MKRGASSSLRSVLKGYLLGLENVQVSRKKCQWFPIYVQTETEDVVSVASFDTRERTRELIERFVRTKAPISITINQSDRGPTFDEGCDISPVNDNSVGFPIRACQIPIYMGALEAKEATVKDIIDLTDNIKGLYNVEGVVCYGTDPLEVRTCKDGTKVKIKVDCFIEDEDGNILRLKLWEDMFGCIENQKRYRFTKVGVFDNYKTGREITPTRASEFQLIAGDVDVPSLKGPRELSKSSNVARINITRFMSNRNNLSFYSCLNCHEPIYVSGMVPEDLFCKECRAESAVEFMQLSSSIEVLVKEEGGGNRWLLMREDVLSTVFDLTKIDNVADSVKTLRDLQVEYNRDTGRVIKLLVKTKS